MVKHTKYQEAALFYGNVYRLINSNVDYFWAKSAEKSSISEFAETIHHNQFKMVDLCENSYDLIRNSA